MLVNTEFQVLFHSPPGVLFTFPSQYWFTIGHWVVFRLGGWSPIFGADSTCPHLLGYRRSASHFAYMTLTFFGSLSQVILLCSAVLSAVLTPDVLLLPVWPPPRSLATTCGISVDVFFLFLLRCFSSEGSPAYAYFIQRTLRDSSSHGFPHSDICGSKLICSSPQLIAACHVLRRLPMPRHSLCALFSLNFSDNISRYCPRFLVIDSFELVTFFRLAIFVVSFLPT